MPHARILQYAEAQARIRARIGALPTTAQWAHIADAADLDNLIERMRGHGLGQWVRFLPRNPDAGTLERGLHEALLDVIEGIIGFLPSQWKRVHQWVRTGFLLVVVEQLLNVPEPVLPRRALGQLGRLAELPLAERRTALAETRYQVYFEDGGSPLDRWWEEFDDHCPELGKREAYVIRRVLASIKVHRARIRVLRDRARAGEQSPDVNAQWSLRDELTRTLRNLIGGDPFHAGLVLIYGLLELSQYERCRALLIARSRGWSVAPVLKSGAW